MEAKANWSFIQLRKFAGEETGRLNILMWYGRDTNLLDQ
jgi:hypothetical protein